ncbi:MAG: helix-turn-helix transcriptional regulator [Lachnospiraceae bacterium]|nr:transcriptional regulator [uncultured Acetatifactor sp.]MCI9571570.1 helix-turn-helix transcriptional regulator [Lachnospiraceae bacterium]
MGRKAVVVFPDTRDILAKMGEQIKLARLRRNLAVELVSERADISRATLWKVEKGDPSVAIGIYAAVLHALGGMDTDLLLVAKDDALGRTLQDLNLPIRRRAPKGD